MSRPTQLYHGARLHETADLLAIPARPVIGDDILLKPLAGVSIVCGQCTWLYRTPSA
ncbi:MAG: hypothetical protein ACOYKD_00615 [Anaerolineaceae bacterium]